MTAVDTVTSEDLHCPMCEYDLRGLAEPRCPECGYRFEWEEIRDAGRRLHPYLFEHHPERNVWSFVRTVVGGWRPRKFWRTLLPTQPSSMRRLVIYHAMLTGALLLLMLLITAPLAYSLDTSMRSNRVGLVAYYTASPPPGLPPGMSAQAYVDSLFPTFPSPRFLLLVVGRSPATVLLILAVGWPAATIATMLIFQQSMRLRKIRSAHMVRCVVYSSDVLLWACLIIAVGAALSLLDVLETGRLREAVIIRMQVLSGALLVMAFPFFTYRLWAAIRHYLRFDHALATTIAIQFIVILAAALVAVRIDLMNLP